MGLPSVLRMTRSSEYAAVRLGGKSRSGRLMTVAFLKNTDLSGPLFGFTLTKRLGNAVVRNLVRRRLREITRGARPEILLPGRIVTIPRPAATAASFAELQVEWRFLTAKLGLLSSPVK